MESRQLHNCEDPRRNEARLTPVESDFAVQLATSVWIQTLADAAAREALSSYALACRHNVPTPEQLYTALEREYLRCRERQDLCS